MTGNKDLPFEIPSLLLLLLLSFFLCRLLFFVLRLLWLILFVLLVLVLFFFLRSQLEGLDPIEGRDQEPLEPWQEGPETVCHAPHKGGRRDGPDPGSKGSGRNSNTALRSNAPGGLQPSH